MTTEKGSIDLVSLLIALVITTLISVVIVLLVREVSLKNQYSSGQIDLATFCNKSTNNGTNESIPVICYEYYKVKQVGTKKVCVFNPALKMTTCDDKPILESN